MSEPFTKFRVCRFLLLWLLVLSLVYGIFYFMKDAAPSQSVTTPEAVGVPHE